MLENMRFMEYAGDISAKIHLQVSWNKATICSLPIRSKWRLLNLYWCWASSRLDR